MTDFTAVFLLDLCCNDEIGRSLPNRIGTEIKTDNIVTVSFDEGNKVIIIK